MTENGSLVKLLFKYFIPNLFSSFKNDLISGTHKTCRYVYAHVTYIHTYTYLWTINYIFVYVQTKKIIPVITYFKEVREQNFNYKLHVTTKNKRFLGCNVFSLVREYCYFESDNQLNLSSKYTSSLSCTFLVGKRAVSSHPLDRLWCTNPLAPRSIQFGISVSASWKNETSKHTYSNLTLGICRVVLWLIHHLHVCLPDLHVSPTSFTALIDNIHSFC